MKILDFFTFEMLKRVIRWILALFFASTLLMVLVYKYLPVYVTPLMVIRCVEQIENGEKTKLSFGELN